MWWLTLGGFNTVATEELKLVLKETPDYGQINATYIIGSRAHSENDPDFLKALAAAGGSVDRFYKDYVESKEPLKLYPFGFINDYEMR